MDDSESESESNSIGSFKPVSRPGARAPHTSKDAGCAWSRAVDTTALVSDPGSDPVRAISLCTNYMLSLLSDTLDVGRFENGAVKLEKVPTDLYAMLAEVSAMAKARANSKRLRFKLEVSPEVPNWVEIDPLRLQQVINNLLSNRYGNLQFWPAFIQSLTPLFLSASSLRQLEARSPCLSMRFERNRLRLRNHVMIPLQSFRSRLVIRLRLIPLSRYP